MMDNESWMKVEGMSVYKVSICERKRLGGMTEWQQEHEPTYMKVQYSRAIAIA